MADLIELMPFCWLLVIGFGLLVHLIISLRSVLPSFVRDVYEYGRPRRAESWFISVPKKWFTHFYLWGTVWNWCLLVYFSSHCLMHMHLPLLDPIVETLVGKFVTLRSGHLTRAHFEVWLVLFLVCLQVSRRLYECLFVNVFSNNKMGLAHYILGLYFYTSVGLTALLHLDSESPLSTATNVTELFVENMRRHHIPPILLFFWAYLHQYRCHYILGQLRKGGKNKSQYTIPTGDWFEFVSSPHFFTEMLIYLALTLCQAVNNPKTPMWLVFLTTCCILTASARQTQQWYREKFDDYPKERKIVIPYVY